MNDKKETRKEIISKRKAMKARDIMARSSVIHSKVFADEAYKRADWIFTYINFGSEVTTAPIIEKALKDNKRVAAPVTDAEKRDMKFVEITGFSGLMRTDMGVLEPEADKDEILPTENTLFIVPGAVFDRKCARIGYGGGYYDVYFAKYPKVYKMGLAFSLQITDEAPVEKHDFYMDKVITEQEIFERGA